jgi:alkyl sulfatase BDS1-like metallo-beta-lactamase superfamily hydrolase
MAVCPAGEEMIGPYLEDRKSYMTSVVKPLQDRADTVFVIPGSDAETHTTKRFPQKATKCVGNGLRPKSIVNFLEALPMIFQAQKAEGLNAIYHFSFTGEEIIDSTINIKNKNLEIMEGHHGSADMHVTADSKTWIAFLSKEKSLLGALLGRKIRLKGSPSLMKAFARCFPS